MDKVHVSPSHAKRILVVVKIYQIGFSRRGLDLIMSLNCKRAFQQKVPFVRRNGSPEPPFARLYQLDVSPKYV